MRVGSDGGRSCRVLVGRSEDLASVWSEMGTNRVMRIKK